MGVVLLAKASREYSARLVAHEKGEHEGGRKGSRISPWGRTRRAAAALPPCDSQVCFDQALMGRAVGTTIHFPHRSVPLSPRRPRSEGESHRVSRSGYDCE